MTITALNRLESLRNPEHILKLNSLCIHTVADLANWPPCVQASLLIGLADGGEANLLAWAIDAYLTEGIIPADASEMASTSIKDLQCVAPAYAEKISNQLGLISLNDLATFEPYLEAMRDIHGCAHEVFCEKPSAPNWLLPDPIGSTQTKARFSNFVKDFEFNFPGVNVWPADDPAEPNAPAPYSNIFRRSSFRGWLGYLALVKQQWVNAGTHLGEVVQSVALAPGESMNLSVVDWFSRQQSRRDEDSTASENLSASFVQNRALNEVVETTAREHLFGQTDIDATTKTSGGGVTGGIGGGSAMNNTSGGAAELDLMQMVNLPISVSGSAGNSNTNSFAGGLGGSYVVSKGTLQGTVYSETTGERSVLGELTQNITDSTVQNASNVRSLLSTVVVTDEQSGGQYGQTKNITNYNHSHALTMQYYEILHKYIVSTRAESVKPLLFLPFDPMVFDIDLIRAVWPIVSPAIRQGAGNRFAVWDQVIKDFDPNNGAFDPSGEIKITSIRVTRSRSWTQKFQVELNEATPVVKFEGAGFRVDDCLDLELKGSNTYVDYDVLDHQEHIQNTFASQSSIDLDETLTWSFSNSFESKLKRELRELVNSATKRGTDVFNAMEFNEIGNNSNRENLIDDVDAGKYRLLNGSKGLELSLDIVYTLEDNTGNIETVSQTESVFFSYSALHSGSISGSFSANTAIDNYVSNISNINPSDQIDEIISYFNFNKYTLTKYLIMRGEKEQIVDAIEQLMVGPIPLRFIIDPSPIGMTDNYLIFCIKDPRQQTAAVESQVGLRSDTGQDTHPLTIPETFKFTSTISLGGESNASPATTGNGSFKLKKDGAKVFTLNGDKHGKRNINSRLVLTFVENKSQTAFLVTGVLTADQRKPDQKYEFQGLGHFDDDKKGFKVTASLPGPRGGKLADRVIDVSISEKPVVVTFPENQPGPLPFPNDFPMDSGGKDDGESPGKDKPNNVAHGFYRYLDTIYAYIAKERRHPRVENVFLPTPGVFGEAVLGRSNASEFVDPSRFYNWQDSPIPNMAPNIGDLDLNIDRVKSISDALGPEVPLTVSLTPTPPTNYAMPTSMTDAFGALQNGAMFNDMSKSSELTSVASQLADLAGIVAQKVGDLSGEAMKNALDSAVSLGNKAADIAGAVATGIEAPAPRTPTEKAATLNTLERISDDPTPNTQQPSDIDQARASTMGAGLGNSSSGGTSGGGSSGIGGGSGTGSGTGSTGGGSTGGSGGSGSGGGGTGGSGSGGGTGGGTPTRTDFELLVRLFIPSEMVNFDLGQMSSSWLPGSTTIADWADYFTGQIVTAVKGDNRTFGYQANSYRAELRTRLSFVDGMNYSPMIDTIGLPNTPTAGQLRNFHLHFGETAEYDHAQIQHVPGMPWWWASNPQGLSPLYPPQRLINNANNVGFAANRTGNRISANLGINAPLPVQTTALQLSAPEITADLNMDFVLNGNQLVVSLGGLHDYFPSYEVYVDQQPVYQYSADPTFGPIGLVTFFNGSWRTGIQPQISSSITL